MPNGGSDCCGTCWFNNKNRNESVASDLLAESEPTICTIRNFEIENPYWTYCANHPHHNPAKHQLPIGAVYIGKGGFPYQREFYLASPDNEEIRGNLIKLLKEIPEVPDQHEYPSLTQLNLEIVKQLGEFKEVRAIDGLIRVINFNPFISTNPPAFPRDNKGVIALAIEALARIADDIAIPFIIEKLDYGLGRDQDPKEYAVIRYYALLALDYCSKGKIRNLYEVAINDPIDEIARVAKERFDKRYQS